MNTVKYIVIIWAAIALCSCVKKVDTARGLTVDIDVSKADKLQPDEWFETVNYIPLKCSQNIVLGKIEKVYSLKDGQFMVYDSKNDQILLFGSDGSFHTKVGQKGHASNEYTRWNDCCYDSEKDCILAFDRGSKRLHVYDAQGQFVSAKSSKRHFSSFIHVDGNVWGYSDLDISNNCMLTKTDMDLQTIHASYFPIKEFVGSTLKPWFSTSPDGKAYFWNNNDNTVYLLKDEPIPFLTVQFGSRTLPYDRILKADYREYDEIRNEQFYLGFIDNLLVTQDVCQFDISESPFNTPIKSYHCIINLKSADVYVFDGLFLSHATCTGIDYINPLGQTSDCQLIFAIEPDKIHDIFFDNLKRVCPSVTRESDPVLAFCKFKSDM